MDTIRNMVTTHGISGIGEIGLDPTYDVEWNRQVEVFVAQLEMAEKMKVPVSIHSRKSLDKVLDIMSSFHCRALLHWFDGSKSKLRSAMDMGIYVSYGPLTVYAADKRRLLSLSHKDRILVETDGPVPFKRCFGGASATPAFLPSVALAAAESLNIPYEEMLRILERNATDYIGNQNMHRA